MVNCALLVALPLTSSLIAEEGRPIVTSFTSHETGGAADTWVTAQDESGVLYFGCDGVLVFDGEHWSGYPVPRSYAVRALAFDHHGRLWVGAMNEVGYFDRTEKGLSSYHTIVGSLPKASREFGDVWQVIATPGGAVFVTASSIFVWDGDSFKLYSLPGSRRLQAMLAGGVIFVSHQPTGLWRLDARGPKLFVTAEALKNGGVIWMEKTTQGWLLATTDGLLRYEAGKVSRFAPAADEFIRRNVLISACRSLTGELCLGTLNGGVAVVGASGAIERVISTEDGLPSRSIYSLFAASDGAVWTTSAVGVGRISIGSGASLYDSKLGLTGKPCIAIAQDDSQILVATGEGIFDLDMGASGSPKATLTLPGIFTDIKRLSDKAIYASGYKRVERIEDGEPKRRLYVKHRRDTTGSVPEGTWQPSDRQRLRH